MNQLRPFFRARHAPRAGDRPADVHPCSLPRLASAICMLGAVLVIAGCQQNRAETLNPYDGLVETMRQTGLDSLRQQLSASPPRYVMERRDITLFVPSDSFFTSERGDTAGAAGFNWDLHAVHGHYYIHDLRHGKTLRTVGGNELVVSIDNDGVWVGTARIVQADLSADAAVMHVTNRPITGPRRVVEMAVQPEDEEEPEGGEPDDT